jgi:hypothetical protein
MSNNYTNPSENLKLDTLYSELGVLEQREFDAIEFQRLDLLPAIRLSQIPLKLEINKLEGFEVYIIKA